METGLGLGFGLGKTVDRVTNNSNFYVCKATIIHSFSRHKLGRVSYSFFLGTHFTKQSQTTFKVVDNGKWNEHLLCNFYVPRTMIQALIWCFDLPQMLEVGISTNILEIRRVSLMED